jgi:hypothetical protein
MTSNKQTITVIYTDEIIKCEKCNYSENSNGKMLSLDKCKHKFHIKCILEYGYNNCHKCPICMIEIDDIRLKIATAFHNNSLPELIECLRN